MMDVNRVTEENSDECYFCGESNPLVLVEHHLIPRAMREQVNPRDPKDFEVTLTLCKNCHEKLHRLLRPLRDYISLEEHKEPSVCGKGGEKEKAMKLGEFELFLEDLPYETIEKLMNVFREESKKNGGAVPREVFLDRAENKGVERGVAREFLDKGKGTSTIYETQGGRYICPTAIRTRKFADSE